MAGRGLCRFVSQDFGLGIQAEGLSIRRVRGLRMQRVYFLVFYVVVAFKMLTLICDVSCMLRVSEKSDRPGSGSS